MARACVCFLLFSMFSYFHVSADSGVENKLKSMKGGAGPIDSYSQRLYWTISAETSKIQSSHLNGRNVTTFVTFPGASRPFDVFVSGGRVYWSTSTLSNNIQSRSKTGEDIQTYYKDGSDGPRQLIVVPNEDHFLGQRTNHCERHKCSKVCVLTPTSFACLE